MLRLGGLTVAQPNSVRTIRKYPNRRLYDTEDSRYITFADIRELVLQEIDFVVIDKRTGEDITRCILLQVICEQEQHGEAILSENFLAQVIRAYGHAASAVIAEHLETSLALFLAQEANISQESASFQREQLSRKIP